MCELRPFFLRGARSGLIVALLFGLSLASYVERVNISVAAEIMMRALSLSKSDLSLVFNSFLVGYAIFSKCLPAGLKIASDRGSFWGVSSFAGVY
jgi:hypothetical protein